MKFVFATLFAAVFGVRPMPSPDGALEPSVQNEVDHAVGLAETWLETRRSDTNAVPAECDLFRTNGLTREAVALRLVRLQRGEGWWLAPTNAAPTRLAVRILKGL